MTPATFLQLFTPFSRVTPNIVSGQLILAAAEMGGPDFSVWPAFAQTSLETGANTTPLTITDLAHGYLTAHLLQTSPMGGMTRLAPEGTDGRSSYLDRFDGLCRSVALGPLVAGVYAFSSNVPGGPIALTAGNGTVALVNGSMAVTFALMQTLAAGTVLAFPIAQGGALYSLAFNLVGTAGQLTAPYTGVSAPAAAWATGTLG